MSKNNNNNNTDDDDIKVSSMFSCTEQKVEKNKQFLFGSEEAVDQDVLPISANSSVTYENLLKFNGYGKIRPIEENIYENICEDCGRLYTASCDFCATDDDDDDDLIVKTSRKVTKLYSKRKLQEFFGSFRLKNVFNSSSPSHKRRKFSKCDIIHNVNGFDDVFRTKQTFDLSAIDQMKKLQKYGNSEFFLAKNADEVTLLPKSHSYSDNLFDYVENEKCENIYENLNFNKFDVINSLIKVDDDIKNYSTAFYDSLRHWMMSLLSVSDDDYVNDVYYYVKSIPSKTFSDCSNLNSFRNISGDSEKKPKYAETLVDEFKSNYEDNLQHKRKHELDSHRNITNFPQIQILYKSQNSEELDEQSSVIADGEKSDFVAGLLDIFEAVLQREKTNSKVDENCGNNSNNSCFSNSSSNSIVEADSSVDKPKLELLTPKTKEPKRSKSLRQDDKRKIVIRKLLLSISLNTIIIDYDKRLKSFIRFNWLCVCSGLTMRVGLDEFCRFLDKNCSAIVIPLEYRRKMLRDYAKRHGVLYKRTSSLKNVISDEDIENVNNYQRSQSNQEPQISKPKNEDIYQNIWTCKTEGEAVEDEEDTKDEIYDEVNRTVAIDEQEWETDEEFSFTKKPHSTLIEQQLEHRKGLKHPNDLYSDICILYNKQNPNQNRLIYDYDQNLVLNDVDNFDDDNYAENVLTSNINTPISYRYSQIPDSVQHWKFLLLDINYIDDEEDVIMTEKSIAAIEKAENNNETLNDKDTIQRILELKNKYNNKSGNSSSNSSLKKSSTPKFRHESKHHVLDHGQDGSLAYKNSDSMSNISMLSDRSDEKAPKKRFRDKFKVMIKKEEKDVRDGTVFGVTLEHLEMDEFENIPKFVTECINIINEEENVKTHGIYRTSGNKMVIENLKKWVDEKKASKKYEILKNQPDIHCITGVLKLFFREMKYPLIPYEMFLDCTRNDDIPYIRDQIHSLDRTSFLLLRYLIKHLKLVELHCEDNKMNSSNLSIVWGGCLMSSMATSCNSVDLISRSGEMNNLFNSLIDNYDLVFT